MSLLPLFLSLSLFLCGLHGITLDVGVLLPLSSPSFPASQWLSSLQLASDFSLPQAYNVTIILHIKDSGGSFINTISQCLALVSEGVQVVIGGEVAEENIAAAQQFLAPHKIPQIAPLSSSTLLLNKVTYPYLVQTGPSNAQQAKALAALIAQYKWTRCTPITSQDDYGTDLLQYFKVEASLRGISLYSAVQFVPGSNIDAMVEGLKSARSSIFVLLTQASDAQAILESARNKGLTGGNKVWIGGGPVSALLSSSSNSSLLSAAKGIITVAPTRGSGTTLTDLETRLTDDSSNTSSVATVGVTQFYDALLFLREAMNNSAVVGNGDVLLATLRNFSYSGVSGLTGLNSYGTFSLGNYDILNVQGDKLVKIGEYSSGNVNINIPAVFPSGSSTRLTDLPSQLRIGFFSVAFYGPWQSLLLYVIDMINEQRLLGGNFTLSLVEGYSNRNSGNAIAVATSMCVVEDVLCVLGASSSGDSVLIAPVMANYKIPLLSYAATSEDLSSKATYPFFLRNIPTDGVQGRSIARFIVDLGWVSCAVLASNDAYGTSILNNFLSAANSLNIQIVTQQLFFTRGDVSAQVAAVKDSKAVVVVVLAASTDMFGVLTNASALGMMSGGYQWITTEAGTGIIQQYPDVARNFTGLLTTVPAATGSTLPSVLAAIATVNQTKYPGLVPAIMQSYLLYSYDAVFMVVDAINRMINDGIAPNNGTSLLQYLYSCAIDGITGSIKIDSSGNRIGMYELDNYNGVTFKRVAIWDGVHNTTFLDSIVWIGNGSKPIDVLPSCAQGYYLKVNSSGPFCDECPPGSYNPISGASECLPCQVGSYADSYANIECKSCAPGSFQSEEGAMGCLPCAPGTMTSAPQQRNCTLCESGTYSNTSGTIKCDRCGLGEYSPTPGKTSCLICPIGMSTPYLGASSYSDCNCKSGLYFQASTNSCVACPEGGVCSGGLAPPQADNGYWFSSNHPYTFYKCADIHACPGGESDSCSAHYGGRLCAHCEDGYTFRDDGCKVCSSGVSAIFVVVVVILVILAVVMVHFLYTQTYIPYMRTLGAGTSIAILISHFQALAIFGIFDSRWPSPLSRILVISSVVNIDLDWLSISCFFGKNFLTTYSLKLLLPAYFIVLALLSLGLNVVHKQMIILGFGRYIRHTFPEAAAGPGKTKSSWVKHRLVVYLAENKPITWRAVVNSFAAFLDLTYIYMISTSFEIFQCYRQPDGSHSLLTDSSISCFSPDWYHLLPSAIIALLFYGIGVPLGFAVILYYGKDKVHEDKFHQTFGYFTQRFRRECYWWQMVTIGRKFLLSFLIVTFAVTPATQFGTSVVVMFTSLIVQLHFRPYALSIHNRDEGTSQSSLLIVLIGGILLLIPADEAFRTVVGVVLLLVIITQILLAVWAILYLLKTFPERSGMKIANSQSWGDREGEMYKVDSASMQAWMSQAASEDESTNLAHMLTKIATFNKKSRGVTQVQLNSSSSSSTAWVGSTNDDL